MKKNIIALAVAAAVAAPMAASADATIYGKLHLDFLNQDDGSDGGLFVSSNDSRIGFKGSEDLGNGLSAIWQIENDIDSGKGDIGGGSFGSRNTYVGLAGGWGAVIVGKHDTPYKITGRKVELFGDTKGDFRQLSDRIKHEARLDNVVAYKLPTMGGFNLLAAYVAPDDTTAKSEAYSINADWSNDMFWVGAGMTQTGEDLLQDAGSDPATFSKNSNWRVAGQMKMAGFKVNAMYDSQEQDADNFEHTGYVLGLAWSTGAHTVKGQYAAYNIKADGGVDQDDASYSLGYDYAFSKKTTAYVLYTAQDTDNGGGSLWKGVSSSTTDDVSAFGVGMVIKF
jgi:predicted porin